MSDYDVGYKKPPEKTQFKKGASGNPKGRSKGNRNLKTDLLAELSESMVISENGKSIKLSKQRVMVKSLCSKAIKGDAQSVRILTNLIMKLTDPESLEEKDINIDDANSTDQELINRYVQRTKETANA